MDELTVTLTHEDIADLTNNMNNAFPEHKKPGQVYLEYLLCAAIRKIKNINFFEEQNKKILAEETGKPETLGDILRLHLANKHLFQEYEDSYG